MKKNINCNSTVSVLLPLVYGFAVLALIFVLAVEGGMIDNQSTLELVSHLFGGITIVGILVAFSVMIWQKIKGSKLKKFIITGLVMVILAVIFVAAFVGGAAFWLSQAQ